MFGNWPKLTIARVSGVPVRLDLTFAIVPFLFARGMQGAEMLVNWLPLLVGIGGIFVSILLHELGHAWLARRNGLASRQIVIGGFYGYVSFASARVARASMIRILLAGPLANLAIFIVLWLVLLSVSFNAIDPSEFTAIDPMVVDRTIRTVSLLAYINLAMFALNLLPAFPLDGGRIGVLLLAYMTSLKTSTVIVAGLGVLIGGTIAVVGLDQSVILLIIGGMMLMTNMQSFIRAIKTPSQVR